MGKKGSGSMLLKFKGDKEPAVSLKKVKKKKKRKDHDEPNVSSTTTTSTSVMEANEQQQQQQQLVQKQEKGQRQQEHDDSIVMSSTVAAGTTSADIPSSSLSSPPSPPPQQQQQQPIKMKLGTGRITTSGTVVMGHNTNFIKEMNIGDAIIIGSEMRIVKMRLSNISINLSSPFSNDLIQPTKFHYVSKPRNYEEEHRQKQKHLQKLEQEKSRTAFGNMYHKTDTLVYREKSTTGTSYVIRKEHLGHDVTRTDLLNMRSKKKSDRYCN